MSKRGILCWISRWYLLRAGAGWVALLGLAVWTVRPDLLLAEESPSRLVSPVAGVVAPAPPAPGTSTPPLRLAAALDTLRSRLLAGEAETAGVEVTEVPALAEAVRRQLDELGEQLRAEGAPPEILDRHRRTVAALESRMAAVRTELAALQAGTSPRTRGEAAGALLTELEAHTLARPHVPLDPDHLPHRRGEIVRRAPRLLDREFRPGRQLLSGPARALPAADRALPGPEDLAESEDVELAPEIRALAAELGGDPLALYLRVRNGIELVPTWGSAQGSTLTLLARRGNAFDQASLLIALLRASGVPARPVVGTVEVPVDAAMAWLGVATPALAEELLAAGGVPVVGVTTGGELSHLRLEHTWVEAWVDYVPGRGARHRPGHGDRWVPLDPSFKPRRIIPPVGLFAELPFDLATLEAQLLAAAEVDPPLGKVAGLDEEKILSAFETYSEEVGEWFEERGLAGAQDALLGRREIVPEETAVFAGSLPYRVLARSPAVAVLPETLRLGVTVAGYTSGVARARGEAAFTGSVSLPRLGSRRLGLGWEPATEADAAILADARARGAASLPLYLIQVRAVLSLDGVPWVTGPAVGMGTTQLLDVVLREPHGTSTVPYEVLAGDEIVVGITAGGITEGVVQARARTMPETSAAENLHQAALHYWMESDFFDRLAAGSLGVQALRRPSCGLFLSPLTVTTLFGAPVEGFYASRFMDVKRSVLAVVGEDPERVASFIRQSGRVSSFLEGLVLDQLFSLDHAARGFSAMELLADANRQGLALHWITGENIDAVLPLLGVSRGVKVDIAEAVARGRTVLIPERELSRGAWKGVGYIIEDPATGAGAYLLSGGLSGGGWLDCFPELAPLADIITVILLISILTLMIIAIIESLGTLAPVLGPAVATIVLFIAMLAGTAPAYAGGGFVKSRQVDPCNCPPPIPPPPCIYETPVRGHYPCLDPPDHWHYFTVHQGPAPTCSTQTKRRFGGCGPPPEPCPPC